MTTIIMFPFMIAWSYYQLVNMKGLYITKKTRCFLHENTYMYPLDLINLHFWRVPMSVS